jgi:protein TonB
MRFKPVLVLSLLLSMAAHGVLLALSRGGSLHPGDTSATRRGLVVAMSVRVEPAATPAQPAGTARPEVPSQADANVASPSPSPRGAHAETASNELPASSAPATVAPVDTTDGGVEYMPRGLLSVVPVARGPVAIPYPRDGPAKGRFSTVLALFIDEGGLVRRVRVDGPDLPPALDAAAREAFLAVRWTPGEFEGRVVKSLIRVEVNFESDPVAVASQLSE